MLRSSHSLPLDLFDKPSQWTKTTKKTTEVYLLTSALELTPDRYMFGVFGFDIIHLLLLHTAFLFEWFLCWVHVCMVFVFVTSEVLPFVTLIRSRAR